MRLDEAIQIGIKTGQRFRKKHDTHFNEGEQSVWFRYFPDYGFDNVKGWLVYDECGTFVKEFGIPLSWWFSNDWEIDETPN